jgi:hypothetical protein
MWEFTSIGLLIHYFWPFINISYSSAFHVRLSDLFPSEWIWKYRSYRQLVRLLGRVISPVARALSTQDNTNAEETWTDIHASSEIRTHDPSVWVWEDISCLRPRGHHRYLCDRNLIFRYLLNIFIYTYIAFGVGWGPHICDWPGLHLTSIRPYIHPIYFMERNLSTSTS